MWTMLILALGTAVAPPDVMCDATVLASSRDLLRSARYGQSERERAAFAVRAPSGELVLVGWPYQAAAFHATYAGAIPAGTIAIVHTHPNIHPYPSAGDERLAGRARLGDWGLQSDVSPHDALPVRRVCS